MKKIRRKNIMFQYDETENVYVITGCCKRVASIEIPTEIDGVPVSAIKDYAFENHPKLESVIFPEYFDCSFEIGEYAFQYCTALKTISLPFGVTTIGRGAFLGCTSLNNVTLPDCYVAPYAFSSCEALTNITPIDTISEGVFSHCSSLNQFPVADTATTIDEDAFEHCDSLTEIVIPKSVTRIEPLAFRGCKRLKSVTFENPEGWFYSISYTGKESALDLSDTKRNAKLLTRMDFDDGVTGWYVK